MPGVIQRVPLAYLDLLGLKSSGDAPHVSPDALAPTLEMRELYLANRWQEWQVFSGIMANTAGAYTQLSATAPNVARVPAGELWILDNWAMAATITATNIVRYRLSITNFGSSANYWVGPESSAGNATSTEMLMLGMNGPIIMRPADQLQVACTFASGAGTQNIIGYVRVAKLII